MRDHRAEEGERGGSVGREEQPWALEPRHTALERIDASPFPGDLGGGLAHAFARLRPFTGPGAATASTGGGSDDSS